MELYNYMASPESIFEGPVVSADQILYDQKIFSHPSYVFEPQFPNTFGQTISLGTSQTPVTINIPPVVFNLSQSYLNFTVTLPAVAGTYTWYAQQALKEISHIQFYAGSNMFIADVDNLQNYLDVVLKKELAQDDFSSLDLNLTGVGPSNTVTTMIPALRNSNMENTNVDDGPDNPSSVNYLEPAYFNVGTYATEVEYNIQFPLRLIKNTLFSVDRDLYFSNYLSQSVFWTHLKNLLQ